MNGWGVLCLAMTSFGGLLPFTGVVVVGATGVVKLGHVVIMVIVRDRGICFRFHISHFPIVSRCLELEFGGRS